MATRVNGCRMPVDAHVQLHRARRRSQAARARAAASLRQPFPKSHKEMSILRVGAQ
nr:hypothetical protein [Kibdelosporangium sp. MJ126-NF4]